ncbi:hypothetical protein FVEN_g5894 [Fusarium venenatum]|uniref:AMP-dependent synthetase/ligase domain-containing protein n=1 Tax=Fusarium venenatum TaxID=56646 RepID=A0A2L2T1Q3_9HYPO|nr:uncharacterized protein FVRRES_05829 [Fusarium venenatum]KAG8356121.1 hypothetical protein FVEN_g5894 [Fusarium venenatum]KAH6992874.1 hypothetical protein EDB82DRAFT_460436 [Fusarium venenatum]CEI61393.1 unnamed protein product [Fusarium venenatum]
MSNFETPSSALQASAEKYPNRVVLKIPNQSPEGLVFKDVTLVQFRKDVELSARYWKNQISQVGAKDRAVVGVWLRGYSYSDAVHIWGLSWAGYIPQLISLRMTDPTVVYELLENGQAVALVYEPQFESMLQNAPLPIFRGGDDCFKASLEELPPGAPWLPTKPDEVVFIYHTSGSTSGIPKLVPDTAKWVDHIIRKSGTWEAGCNMSRERMTSSHIGSFCHMAASFILWFAVREGSCVILPSVMPQPISEIKYLLDEHGLSNLCLFPPFMSAIIRQARNDPSLLASLKKADCVGSGGLDPDPADVAWGRSQGLHMLNVLGSTELGMPMQSDARENTDYLLPLSGSKYEFVPIGDSLESGEPLLELVCLPESPDCPVPSLCAANGKFYSGDLFIEPSPGKYLCKGRNDNWIKMQSALRCDTASIEFNVMETCGDDLVNAVIVVGMGRPCPTIMVEPKGNSIMSSEAVDDSESAEKLKGEILKRIEPFHKRRYEHERVSHTRYIVVVPQGSMPRTITKGNVRRKEVEKMYEAMLDTLYAI